MNVRLFAAAVLLSAFFPMTAWAGTSARAMIVDNQGKQIGSASLKEHKRGVQLKLEIKGISPGPHGMHIHGVGQCSLPDFKSAGPHFNPHHKQHGLKNPAGSHSGDLPNIEVNKKGKGKVKALVTGVSLREGEAHSLLGGQGTSIVIHAGPDDHMTDPAGNSGDRIACGVIEKN